jgi:hypothetical protein
MIHVVKVNIELNEGYTYHYNLNTQYKLFLKQLMDFKVKVVWIVQKGDWQICNMDTTDYRGVSPGACKL